MVAALIVGPTVLILNMLTSSTGSLLNTFLFNSFDTAALNPQKREWMSSWTLYYWGWWLSWKSIRWSVYCTSFKRAFN
ncbi:BCCT family transporter [Staphylococcus aureus]|nr:BCCT family transporter [Staphylococcus aureus]